MFGRTKHTEASIAALLTERGASEEDAHELVRTLGRRLSPKQMHVWLADDRKSHPVPDDASELKAGLEAKGLVVPTLHWTPINAISAGKTDLVLAEARRFVGDRSGP